MSGISAENVDRLFNGLLHHQIQRHGHGTIDLPFDHPGPWGTDVGRQQYRAGRDVSVHSAIASRD